MTFYSRQVRKLKTQLYPRQDLTARIIKAKQFIDSNYSEDIELDSICREAYLSKFHFIRLFKKHYGRTPHQYVTRVRVAKAKKLIGSGMTVRGACLAVGYNSLTSFSTLFKKMTGSSPSGYRKKSNSG
ncbi:MAG: AraC family transcriptional regulator [Balneolaceae bacterium]